MAGSGSMIRYRITALMRYQYGGVSKNWTALVTDDDGTAKWIEAGLAALARGGIDHVRVEVLAKDLGVTKGGFYRRFADRRALLGAILETWARGRIAAIEQHAKLDGVSARQRLRELIRLYSETVNPRGMAVELGSVNGRGSTRPQPRSSRGSMPPGSRMSPCCIAPSAWKLNRQKPRPSCSTPSFLGRACCR